MFKGAVAKVLIERVRVAGEVGLHDVEQAIAVVVTDGNAHAGLRLAVRGVGDAGLNGLVFEGAILLVLVVGCRRRVVGDIDVGPAIVVEIRYRNAEAVGADGVPHAGLLGDIGKGAVAVVVVQDVFAAIEARRTARDLHAFVGAPGGLRQRRGLDVEVDVIGDEEIKVAVTVVVEKRTAGVPALPALDEAGLCGDIREGAIAVVLVKNRLAIVAHEEIIEAIVVIIAHTTSLAPAGARHAALRRDVGEGAVAIVLEETTDGLLALWKAFQTRAVHEEQIKPVIMIEVVEGDAAAGGLQQEAVAMFIAIDGPGVQTALLCDVEEAISQGRTRDRRRQRLRGGTRLCVVGGSRSQLLLRRRLLRWKSQFEHVLERQNKRTS